MPSLVLSILIGVLSLMVIVMTVIVFILACKKVGGCREDAGKRCGAAGHRPAEINDECPAYHPLLPNTRVSDKWIYENISPCPNPKTKEFCYYQGSNGNLCIDGAKHETGEDVCSPQWCPYGMSYTPNGCVSPTTAGENFPKHRILSQPIKPLLTKDQLDSTKVYVEITDLDSSIKERYVPRPTLALYHGGVVGAAMSDPTGKIFRDYMTTVATFCKQSKIDTLLISLDSYTPKGATGDQYTYLQDPSYLANLVDNVIHPIAPSTTLGVVAYVRPKDAGWTDDPRAKGGCIGDTTCNSTCQFIQNSEPNGCPRYCTTDPCGVSPCPPGCPNQLSQAVSYVGKVNALINSGQLLEDFVFDGEDAGDYASGCGFWVGDQANTTYAGKLKRFGYAKALQAGVVCYPEDATNEGICSNGSKPVSSMVFPETYWYMNDLWPCTGSPSQLAARPPVCTTQTSYQRFKNQPVALLNYLLEADRCGYGSNGLASLKNNLESPYGDNIWPMFSLEKLSAVGNTVEPGKPPKAGGPSSCLAMAYSGGAVDAKTGWPVQSDTCGTFDGFGTWNWEHFLQFMALFAHHFGAKQVGIYEAQFLPWSTEKDGVSWIDPKDPLPPTIPKTCDNNCSYCNFSCTKDDDDDGSRSCKEQLAHQPSCKPITTPNGTTTYYAYCENSQCKIKENTVS